MVSQGYARGCHGVTVKPEVCRWNRRCMPQKEETAVETQRLTAQEIFDAATENARSELRRSWRSLAVSGFAGGITLGLTGIGVAAMLATLGEGGWQEVLAYCIYPVGFIAVIIGRQQLFTENTLYPVVLVLDERRHVLATLRLWAVVFGSNVAGAVAFAALVIHTLALKPEVSARLVGLGFSAAQGTFSHFFWSGVVGGWLIALVAWMVTASHWTIGQVVMIWLLTFIVGIGHFAHCIVTSCEILSAVMAHAVSAGQYLHWLAPATLGNIVGGVFIVSVLNYGQVRQK
jgi:formate-nitrite transporter family protein